MTQSTRALAADGNGSENWDSGTYPIYYKVYDSFYGQGFYASQSLRMAWVHLGLDFSRYDSNLYKNNGKVLPVSQKTNFLIKF